MLTELHVLLPLLQADDEFEWVVMESGGLQAVCDPGQQGVVSEQSGPFVLQGSNQRARTMSSGQELVDHVAPVAGGPTCAQINYTASM